MYSEYEKGDQADRGTERTLTNLEVPVAGRSRSPLLSIIIYAHNNWTLTAKCVSTIVNKTYNTTYEIIIADDNSNDDSIAASKAIKGLKVHTNLTGLGYLRTCNKACRLALGKYVIFFHNDSQVEKNWVEPIVKVMEEDSTVGIIGPKLLFPDGKLQEAGGIVWRDGRLSRYGFAEEPEMPEYNYLKEVDYVSGACLAIRKELWNDIGGFDEQYSPAYYEDVDLAFEVRKRGFRVVNQPKSIVYHAEQGCYGSGGKYDLHNYRMINRTKFLKKWSKELAGHFHSHENMFHARDRSNAKPTILVIDHYVPHFDKDAGSRTMTKYLELFLELGLHVKFIGDNFFKHEPYTSVLQNMGIEVLYGSQAKSNITKWIDQNANDIDYVLFSRPHITIKYVDQLARYPHLRLWYYGHDLHYLSAQREYDLEKDPSLLERSQKWKKIEFNIFKRVDTILTISHDEQEIIQKVFPDKQIVVIPCLVFDDMKGPIQDFAKRKDIMFVGGFAHPPNVGAVLWFVNECLPRILDVMPNLKFFVVGSNPPKEIRQLKSHNVIITGYVSDKELDTYYKKTRMIVIPLTYGAGVKGKTIEAFSYGLPVVSTRFGIEGLGRHFDFLRSYDSPEEFADRVISLYNDDDSLRKISNQSVEFVNNNFNKTTAMNIIRALI
jgi:GT2 family glycosyltransferase